MPRCAVPRRRSVPCCAVLFFTGRHYHRLAHSHTGPFPTHGIHHCTSLPCTHHTAHCAVQHCMYCHVLPCTVQHCLYCHVLPCTAHHCMYCHFLPCTAMVSQRARNNCTAVDSWQYDVYCTVMYCTVCHDVLPRYYMEGPPFNTPPFLNEPRRAFERLLRKLLGYPNRPAVVLLHAYAWNQVTWGGGRGGCQRIGGGRVGRGSGTV